MANENEILTDEQLDNVAGGTQRQIEHDIDNFKRLGIVPGNANNHDKGLLERAFALYGIQVEPHGGHLGKSNKYRSNGVEISQDAAWGMVMTRYNGGYRPQTN